MYFVSSRESAANLEAEAKSGSNADGEEGRHVSRVESSGALVVVARLGVVAVLALIGIGAVVGLAVVVVIFTLGLDDGVRAVLGGAEFLAGLGGVFDEADVGAL